MSYLLLILSLTGNAFRATISKFIGRDYVSKGEDPRLFNTVSGVVTSLLLLCASSFSLPLDKKSILLALLFGFVYFIAFFSYSKAISLGSMSYTTLFTSLGMIIPIVYSSIFLGEVTPLIQVVGFILLISSLVIMNTGKKESGRFSLSWIIWVFISFLASGSISLIQKLSSSIGVSENSLGFLSITFAFYTLFSALSLIFYHEKLIYSLKRVVLSALQGLCDALQHSLNFILASLLPAIFLFPTLGGGAALLAVLVSVIFFKEKFSLREKISVLLIIISLVLLSIS